MAWIFTSDVEVFAGAAEPWLLRDPVRNTAPLTVLRGIRAGVHSGDVLLAWLEEDGRTVAAAVHAPPRGLLLPDLPASSVPSLAAALIEAERVVPEISGPLAQVEAFAASWWRPVKRRILERLYRLESVSPLRRPVSGAARTAGTGDRELLAAWLADFHFEALGERAGELLPVVSSRIGREELVLWEDGGRPVACAAFSAPIGAMSRIGPVYTPPEFRGRGYGEAVTRAVTREALDAGATEVLLFTDLGNPVSNSVYQAIGYRAIADYAEIAFG
ncbi:GNAT family N-acetyltransferase [Planomonospora parontospora]|uniref:GNAT family N-acetyltransferase n=1 Tax=Planomonospora parontospora TaxID=58119 RepID=UPI00167066C7|nr:GNAT family N-acetyltransferase [Planomonospora parontospora]GGL44029.1 N-acetyltransferase [Planomonospora parontospora subsp. antibiotica]GII18575.1 N-acetyltransferase [Planomonospora parontospora subsp. antibiotica]